jgi:two-component system NarL family sensor kinase
MYEMEISKACIRVLTSATTLLATAASIGLIALCILVRPALHASSILAALTALVSIWAQGARLTLVTRRAVCLRGLLRQVLRALANVRQAERDRTGRDLHDGVCQLLIATRHSLELAAERLSIAADCKLFLTRGLKQLNDAIAETRRVSHDLKSVLLLDHDFSQAILNLCREFGESSRIAIDCKLPDICIDDMLTAAAKSTLIRIVQEALTNIQKHSSASHVEVTLECTLHHVELRVVDNGSGFEKKTAGHGAQAGIGINNMRERAAALGGTLSIRPTGSGFELHVHLPISSQQLL